MMHGRIILLMDLAEPKPSLLQYPNEEMQYRTVENEEGNVKNQGPQLIESLEPPKTLAF